jgi:hypothetical protein
MNQNRFKVAFLTCSTKACAADLVAQWIDRTAEKRRIANNNEGGGNTKNTQQASPDKKLSIDFRRAAVFLLYGGLYQGMAQEYIYNDIYATLFGSGTDILTASKKVSAEMFVLTPLLCIPAAYLIKGLLGGNTIRGALKKYRDDVIHRKILFINWSKCFGRHDKSALTCAIDIYKLLSVLYHCKGIWIPVNFLVFSFVPEHFRVTFVALVSFFWTMILSKTMSRK